MRAAPKPGLLFVGKGGGGPSSRPCEAAWEPEEMEEEEMSLTSAAAPPVTSQPLLFPPATGACTPTHRASWRGPAFIPGRLRAASRGGGGGGGLWREKAGGRTPFCWRGGEGEGRLSG